MQHDGATAPAFRFPLATSPTSPLPHFSPLFSTFPSKLPFFKANCPTCQSLGFFASSFGFCVILSCNLLAANGSKVPPPPLVPVLVRFPPHFPRHADRFSSGRMQASSGRLKQGTSPIKTEWKECAAKWPSSCCLAQSEIRVLEEPTTRQQHRQQQQQQQHATAAAAAAVEATSTSTSFNFRSSNNSDKRAIK